MALISHIQVLEIAFENGTSKFLISEIIDFLDKEKQRLIFDSVFSQVDTFFDILSIFNTPHDFLELLKLSLKLAQLGPILEGGHSMLPPPPRKK